MVREITTEIAGIGQSKFKAIGYFSGDTDINFDAEAVHGFTVNMVGCSIG